MTNVEAKDFLLKTESYTKINLPIYFSFKEVLAESSTILKNKELNSLMVSNREKKLYNQDDVNYTLLTNKDDLYSWRPLTLIHPLIYVDLVNLITEKEHWDKIIANFTIEKNSQVFTCVSLPTESKSKRSDQGENILNWWKNFEQLQIKHSMEYKYCMHVDIANCYGSIYTHSIPWAIHTREVAKKDRKKGLGNKIDRKISDMQYGQTNGIPQGSVLMDLIAEIVLYGADMEFEEALKNSSENYYDKIKILRFRDDYRIFANSKAVVENVTKKLTEVLSKWNFKLNSSKTFLSDDIISDAIKEDKLYWTLVESNLKSEKDKKYPYKIGIQKYLLQIKILADKYPNSGSLKKALTNLYKSEINKWDEAPTDILQTIAIVIDIMEDNPKVIEHCVAILSKLLDLLEPSEALKIIDKTSVKFEKYSNTEFISIWLQRLEISYSQDIKEDYSLIKKVKDPKNKNIWNHDWLAIDFDESIIIDQDKINELDKIIDVKFLDIFNALLTSEDI